MPLKSMTGFARIEDICSDLTIRWELKSVNGRNLDLRLRLPQGFEGLEHELRSIGGRFLLRGHVSGTLGVEFLQSGKQPIIDEQRLQAILAVSDRLVAEGRATQPTTDGLLALRGVLDSGEDRNTGKEVSPEDRKAVSAAFERAVLALDLSRTEEGEHLETVVEALIDRIETLTNAARSERSRNPEMVRQRIEEQVRRLTDQSVDEQRLLQELALIAVRADVGEELDRLGSHIATARELLVKNEPVGRRFDFLAQEMNRESNTVCSKSNAVSLTAIGLDLKVAVDQLREQVQNIE